MKLNLDLAAVTAQTGGLADLVPEGTYVAKVTSAEAKANKANTGGFLEVVFQIQEGQYAGRNIVERLNIQNQNQDAVRIALGKLKGILELGGHPNPNMLVDTDDMLKLKPIVLIVSQEKSVDGDKEYTNNRINKYKAYDGKAAPAPAAAPAAAPAGNVNPFAAAPAAAATAAAPAAAGNTFPWGQPK